MKTPYIIILLCASFLVGGCASFDSIDSFRKSPIVQATVQAATLYVAMEHPELAPEAHAIGTIATGDAAERDAALRAIYQGYVHRLAEDGLEDKERREAAAIAAFADAVLTLAKQRPDLLPWLAEYLDATIKPLDR